MSAALPLAWVVPGPVRQLTGGYLYDARIVDGLRAGGRDVRVLDLGVTRWPLDAPAGRRLTRGIAGGPLPAPCLRPVGPACVARRRSVGERRSAWGAVVVDELAHPALAAAILAGRLRRALGGAPLVVLVHHLRCSEPSPWTGRLLALAVEALAVRAADLVVCTSETTARTVRPLVRPGVPVAVVRPGWDTLRPGPEPASAARRHPPDTPDPAEQRNTLPDLPLSRVRERGSGGEGRAPEPGTGGEGRAPESGGEGRERESGGPGDLRLLLVGHWTPRKGILDALAAVARVNGAGDAVSLDLVGEQDRDPAYAGRVRAALRNPDLAGRVRVHGRLSDAALAARYRAADALLLPSGHEGYGMVLAEALAAGLPIVATRVGAVPEVVRDGLEAELVPPGDAAALASAIRRLAASPADRAVRARLALERARALPTWDDSIAAFGALLDGLAAGDAAGRPR